MKREINSGLNITLSIDGKEIKSVFYEIEDGELVLDDLVPYSDSIVGLTFSGSSKVMAEFIKSLDENYNLSCKVGSIRENGTEVLQVLIGELALTK